MKSYYRAKFWPPIWEHVVNRRAAQGQRSKPLALTEFQATLARGLAREGIVTFELDQLLGAGAFDALQREARELFARPDVYKDIADGRGRVGGKEFVVRVFKRDPVLDLSTTIGALCVDPRIIGVVNEYFGLYCRLKSFDLWHNVPVRSDVKAVSSQRWHRDYDDRRLVKLFVYLVDVDESMGPFSYFRETQPGARFAGAFPSSPPLGSYPNDGVVEHRIPGENRLQCVGRAGTAILCDTTGLHCGGRSTTRPRELFVATYATDAAIDPDAYLVRGLPRNALGEAERFAIRRR